MIIQPLKGTRDFYPKDMATRVWLFDHMRHSAKLFGYQETEGPYIEPFELYAVKSGEELVNEQTFHLHDRGGRKIALRPEITPTVSRMLAQKSKELQKPIRWFSIGPAWRYEQPQKGRGREFFQWEVNMFAANTPLADAEVLCVAASFLQSIGLTPNNIKLKINDRQLVEKRLTSLGVSSTHFGLVLKAIDRKEKIPASTFREMLHAAGLSDQQQQKLESLLSDKDLPDDAVWLRSVFDATKTLGFGNWIEYDPMIVRGLLYYTRTVFEAHDVKGEFRAIFGGGRFDNLVEALGGKENIDGVGFAIGDMVLTLLLEQNKKIPILPASPTKILVTVFDEKLVPKSIDLARQLREAGIPTELYPIATKLDKQLAYADKQGIPYAVILGPDEVKSDVVVVKDLLKRTQQKFLQRELVHSMESIAV
ncbi:MAG: histidine--tRNA ligase [bacterium]|nr:histidine--tRNA ligase [bacterium]